MFYSVPIFLSNLVVLLDLRRHSVKLSLELQDQEQSLNLLGPSYTRNLQASQIAPELVASFLNEFLRTLP